MRNLHKFLGIIAIGALIMNCASLQSGSSNTSSNPDIDSAIVAKWYTTQSNADDGGTKGLVYEFKADGTYLDAGNPVTDATFTAKDGKVIATKTESGDVKTSATYVINGKELVLSETEGSIGRFKAGKYFKSSERSNPNLF